MKLLLIWIAPPKATYDPSFLEFSNATAGDLASASFFVTLHGNPYTDGALMAVDVSLAGPSTLSSGTGSILALLFNILPDAPLGVTPVSFEAIDTDYDVPKTTGNVYVIAQEVPEPVIFFLLLPALLLMRCRGKGEAEQHLS